LEPLPESRGGVRPGAGKPKKVRTEDTPLDNIESE
jgi:hypothetical protein